MLKFRDLIKKIIKNKFHLGTDLEEQVHKADEDEVKEINKEKVKNEKKREETRQWSNISNIKDLKKLVKTKILLNF